MLKADSDDEFDLEMGPAETLELRIKSFILGPNSDLPIRVHAQAQVAILKDIVKRRLLQMEADSNKSQAAEDSDRYIRLICKGKLLAPDSASLSEFSMQSDDVVHAVLAAQGVRGGQQAALSRATPLAASEVSAISGGRNSSNNNGNNNTSSSNNNSSGRTNGTSMAQSIASSILTGTQRRRTGVVIGPGGRVLRTHRAGDSDDDDDGDSDSDDSNHAGTSRRRNNAISSSNRNASRHMGFDRLRTSGLSRAQIRVIRTYFSRSVDRHIQQHPNDHLDEPDLMRRRLLMEEDWMSLQGPTSDFRINLNQSAAFLRYSGSNNNNNNNDTRMRSTAVGNDRDFVWGFFLGFFFGFIMLLWVWMPTVPHKQKIGILTGISFQLAMNVFQQQEDIDQAGPISSSNFADGNNLMEETNFEQDYAGMG